LRHGSRLITVYKTEDFYNENWQALQKLTDNNYKGRERLERVNTSQLC